MAASRVSMITVRFVFERKGITDVVDLSHSTNFDCWLDNPVHYGCLLS